jgi:predicted peptidase
MRLLHWWLILPSLLAAGEAPPWTEHPLDSTPAPYGYLQWLPPAAPAPADGRHPLVLFLHGLGELGDSTTQLAKVAGGPFPQIRRGNRIFTEQSAICIAPQGLKADKWWKVDKLVALVEHLTKTLPLDPQRLYVTGLSMGGGATWDLALRLPDRFAAIVPICGASAPGKRPLAPIAGLPVWAHHAAGDQTVKYPVTTRLWIEGLLAAQQSAWQDPADPAQAGTAWLTDRTWNWSVGVPGTGPRRDEVLPDTARLLLTVYPDKSHDSWSRTYDNPAVWRWLFAQRRPTSP